MIKTLFFFAAGLLPLGLSAAIAPGSNNLGAVWFVGDSITQSNADGDANGSPRKSLYDLLVAHSYTFTFTGHYAANTDGLPASGGTPETNLYQYHSGISGSVIGNDTSGRVGMTQNLPAHWTSGRLAMVKPNVVLIMLGTNDINSDIDRPNAPARLTAYLNAVYSQPGIGNPTVLVASIPPNRTNASKPAWVSTFNAEVPGVVGAQRALGRDVHFVDQFTPIETNYATLMQADNLHPNAAGNASLAQQWFNKIEEIVNGAAATGTGILAAVGDKASAETDNTPAAGMTTAATFAAGISSTDLANAGRPTLSGVAIDQTPPGDISPGSAALNDGLGHPSSGTGTGVLLPATSGSNGHLPFIYTVTLDTTTSTAGYDINAIRSFTGWNQNGSSLANQKYELLVSVVGNSGFTSLGTYTYTPFGNADTAEAAATRLVLTKPGGFVASGVDQVRFVFLDHGFDNHAGAPDGTVYQEVEVIGVATPIPVNHGITASGVSVAAETNNSGASGYATAATYAADISVTDLINAGQPTLASAAWDKTPVFESNTVNNGTGHPVGSGAGTFLPATFGTGNKMPFTYTANLNTTTNTLGYTITEIRSFAGWNMNGAALANQKYELWIRKVGSAAFESLGTYEYSPFSNASTQEAAASKMTLTPDDGVIATGVDAVRFVVMDHGSNSADVGGSTVDGTVFHEFDVLGTPVTPPSVGVISLQGSQVAAETDNSSVQGFAAASSYSADIVADDLINAGRPSLLSTVWDKTPFFESNTVNNGTGHPAGSGAGTYLPGTFGTGTKMPFTYTATLNLTNAPNGYRITGIRSFAGWNMNGAALANQKYELLVSPVGNEGFYSLGTFEYSPFNNASTQEAGATRVVLSADDGVLATGVDAVRFRLLDHGFNNGGAPDGTVYQEFDVLGAAVVPGFEAWAGGFGIPPNENHDGNDHDGIPALIEYALGFSPLMPETLPALDSTQNPARITWPKGGTAAADPTLHYLPEVSTDLDDWDVPTPGEIVETANEIRLHLSPGDPRRFGRLKVTREAP
ncbi:hypothetical protein KBB96_01160 [Luteolibacter ambystomatis]|uniref:SGNH hydrolase-type esterase domain-containing protein n=1 Tax=Luteolibacter ambystomatis TaxID=2824561 RepID=A0A975G9W9_9BACT|nr:GDSL-type esterase/lipase family protein [Luteolibacter ambystomatis]QUE51516.1 hypothetical protein KBB96_01160 [Luteolibacter ambystomatis]